MRKRYSVNDLATIVKKSYNLRQVLIGLGLCAEGSNYKRVRQEITDNNIDISHFTRSFINRKNYKKTKFISEISLDKLLINGSLCQSNKLKNRLIKEGIFERKCYCCGNTEWMGEPIPLELEHINGKSDDNRIENLTILCNNCHAQTKFWRGRNIQGRIKNCSKCNIRINNKSKTGMCYNCLKLEIKEEKLKGNIWDKDKQIWVNKKIPVCSMCGNPMNRLHKLSICWNCHIIKQRKVVRPPIEQLKKEIEELGFCAVGRKYGVSDNAIRKWIKFSEKYI